MKCICAQTRPRFILSSERVWGGGGMEFEPMLTPRENSPPPENFPRGGSNPRRCGQRAQTLPTSYSGPVGNHHHHHYHHHGGPSVSRMTLSVPLICGYGSGSAGRSWTRRAVRSLGTGSSHLSLGYRLPSGGVLWRTVLDGDALPLAQMTQIVKVCASAVCPEQ